MCELWWILQERNKLVERHNALDFAFHFERRALRREIKRIEQDIVDCFPDSKVAQKLRKERVWSDEEESV